MLPGSPFKEPRQKQSTQKLSPKERQWKTIYDEYGGRYDDLVTAYQNVLDENKKLKELIKESGQIPRNVIMQLLTEEQNNTEYANSSDVCRGLEIAKAIVTKIGFGDFR